ncbi:MAG: hypothetical protein QM687_13555 [Ferruginibacter sp.]
MNLKESRISFLILFSLCLLLLAFIILFAWGFMYYRNAAEEAKTKFPVNARDSIASVKALNDSLQKRYEATWAQLNQQLDAANSNADSIQGNIDVKYKEFSQIRSEIAQILDVNKTPSQMEAASVKLVELQLRLDDWRRKYNDVAAENTRLSNLLRQLTASAFSSQDRRSIPTGTVASQTDNEVIPVVNRSPERPAAAMQVQSLQLRAEPDGDKTRLRGNFDVTSNDNNNAVEMYVVITQPDGKLLKQSGWDSGSFETKEGSRIYSCKLRFDIDKGENKSLNFSVPSSNFQKGVYSIMIYHKGVMIARGSKSLS